MQHVDPTYIVCPNCSGRSAIFIKDLRSGEAACPECDFLLVEACRRFNALESSMRLTWDVIWTMITIEEALGVVIPDEDMPGDELTFEQLTLAVSKRLPSESDPVAKAREIVEAARNGELQ